jgi:2-polyprenyl-6-methoxyphenol hydroxylase-like FAD-dependent oxidoreductase
MQQQEEDIVIVGAGLAGLAVALGLHRKGVRSVVVLESSPALRASGFALPTWSNAFRALDALGVGDKIRELHPLAQGLRALSWSTGEVAQELDFRNEFRCVRRDLLLQVLAAELPSGAIRYSSKVVSVEDGGDGKTTVHLADGSALRAKVLVGCDGINSVVAKWLGLAKPSHSGRLATRGLARYPGGHGFEPKFLQLFGRGFRFGLVPCNHTDVYWFYTWSRSKNGQFTLLYIATLVSCVHRARNACMHPWRW